MEECPAPIFPFNTDGSGIAEEILSERLSLKNIRSRIVGMDFIAAYDLCRELSDCLISEGREAEAIAIINSFDAVVARSGIVSGLIFDLRAALLHIKTAILIQSGDSDNAKIAAAECLNLLAQNVKRRDEAFLSVLAALLYDIARLHIGEGKYRQAEREIEKSAKIFERLARTKPQRYGAAHIMAVDTATKAHLSKVKQAQMLADLHIASDVYMKEVNSGVENAAANLIDSLESAGATLMQMGREREAVQYFTRALKYLSKIETEFSMRQLELSVKLGEALLGVKSSRDKGVHLLNTMLHKASRLNADALHKKIVDILYNAKNHGSDILGFWHKLFPR
ncbi:MAG: hypothetical protein HDT08_00130 [Bacteroidales bacterium]|nr:hypothetical protein [Bacteroidales bacterium]